MPYAPATDADVAHMLARIGVASVDDLFADIPPALRFTSDLDLPSGVSELELMREARSLAAMNVDTGRELSFLGYGYYDHYVPAVCGTIAGRSEFATAYTPYQPEVSQGTLQAIFEFQTAISELVGLPVSNASLYDGATAAAEAMYVSEQLTGRDRAIVLGTVHPHVRQVLDTYAHAYDMKIDCIEPDVATGITSVAAVEAALADDVACVIMQQPTVFGTLEDAPRLCAAAREVGAVPVVHADPLSLGVLEAPGMYGAGIVVGEGQGLGNSLSFGGPSFGFMAAESRFTRRMPGRIVGRTKDADGTVAYVLTLQTREQHIRRDKATSNICTNQALNALAGIVYMSWLGGTGLHQLGTLLLDRAEQLRSVLASIPGVSLMHDGPVFKECVVQLPRPAREVIAAAKQRGVHPGYPIGEEYPELGPNALLVAVTEQRTDQDLHTLASVLTEVLA